MKPIKSCLLMFLLVLSQGAVASQSHSLDDWAAPDEIAAELGFPRTEVVSLKTLASLEDIRRVEGLDLTRDYPLIIVINKSATGPGAQTVRVIENGRTTYEWKTSTGRERMEKAKSGRQYFSTTPTGWFYPYYIVRNHYSNTWQVNMEFSVFFNGGIAVHATTPDLYYLLGKRASGGCVRLRHEGAEYLYSRILQLGKGLVPVVRRNGSIARNWRGHVIREYNYKTLIIVEGT